MTRLPLLSVIWRKFCSFFSVIKTDVADFPDTNLEPEPAAIRKLEATEKEDDIKDGQSILPLNDDNEPAALVNGDSAALCNGTKESLDNSNNNADGDADTNLTSMNTGQSESVDCSRNDDSDINSQQTPSHSVDDGAMAAAAVDALTDSEGLVPYDKYSVDNGN